MCWGLWSKRMNNANMVKRWKQIVSNEIVSIPQLNREYCDIRVRNDICIQWVRCIKWEDVEYGKRNNSDIVSNELKWSLKNVKCYFWWRSIGIESFERKCIRSYALNWGYFSVWCDGNLGDKRSDKMFQFNRFVFCFVFVYGN